MKPLNMTVLVTASLLYTGGAYANGAQLHTEANCMKCHQSQAYNPQKTRDYPTLVKRVTGCSQNFNTGWFDEDIDAVAQYLNQTYYHFKK